MPAYVVQGSNVYSLTLPPGTCRIDIHEVAPIYTIQQTSSSLTPINEHLPFIRGSAQLVRIVVAKRGQKQTEVLFYYGRVRALTWDPNRLFWSDHSPFMDYSTQKGRAFLRRTHPPPRVAEQKWNHTLPADFDFRWVEIWVFFDESARKPSCCGE